MVQYPYSTIEIKFLRNSDCILLPLKKIFQNAHGNGGYLVFWREKQKNSSLTIFRSTKVWFPLQMKTIGLSSVAAAWRKHAESETQAVKMLHAVEQVAPSGCADEQSCIDLEKEDRGAERRNASTLFMFEITGNVILFNDPLENATHPHYRNYYCVKCTIILWVYYIFPALSHERTRPFSYTYL